MRQPAAYLLSSLLLPCGFAAAYSLAMPLPRAVSGGTAITITGTLVDPPPCTINGDKPIEVEFGDVITRKVDGVNYAQEIVIPISCYAAPGYPVSMQVLGAAAGFDSALLGTDNDDLAIRLTQAGSLQPINALFHIDPALPVQLKATLVKKTGVTLSGGDFQATSTVRVSYE